MAAYSDGESAKAYHFFFVRVNDMLFWLRFDNGRGWRNGDSRFVFGHVEVGGWLVESIVGAVGRRAGGSGGGCSSTGTLAVARGRKGAGLGIG